MSKITFQPAQSLPLDKLAISAGNVRRIKAGVGIEQLAEDIKCRGLLQSLVVRPVLDADGAETGRYGIAAGGRRFAALQLLVKTKRLARNAPVPCIVRCESEASQELPHARHDGVTNGGPVEEDSLAENTMREALHPLDQFRAFQALREEHGVGDEEIAARFFVTPAVVRQRLKLATVSPKLLDLYAEEALTLEQLMVFSITADHERQEAVWEALSRSHSREPYAIRRLLNESSVRASDKRAVFVGLDSYVGAGGVVDRDLFADDNGGYLRDAVLLARLVEEKLQAEAEQVRQEGWLWVEAAADLPYGHRFGLRRLQPEAVPLDEQAQAERDRLKTEYDALEAEYATSEDLPDAADLRLTEIEQLLAQLDAAAQAFDPAEVARAGAFVGIDHGGTLKIERGFVRPADEAPVAEPNSDDNAAPVGHAEVSELEGDEGGASASQDVGPATSAEPEDEEPDDGGRLPDRLMTELTAHRTVALRAALSADPDAALLALLHALVLRAFYGSTAETCLEIDAKSIGLAPFAPGLNDAVASRTLIQRHDHWQAQLPRQARDLWSALMELDVDSRAALLALCVGRSVNALVQPWERRPGVIRHADQLAGHVGLDMVAEGGWAPTVESYLGRVTKARILAAVSEARGESATSAIAQLRKPEMAQAAEALLAGTGWLPMPLRTPELVTSTAALQAVAQGDAPTPGREPVDRHPAQHAIAAE